MEQQHYDARMRVYRVVAAQLKNAGSEAVLFGGFLRRLLSGESMECDLDVYADPYLPYDQMDFVCSILSLVGWCTGWTMLRPFSEYEIGVRRLQLVMGSVSFTMDLLPCPPPGIDFDVSNLRYASGALQLRVKGGCMLDTLMGVRERQARAIVPPEHDSVHQSRLLRRQLKLMKAGYSIEEGYTVAPMPRDTVCPIVLEHTQQAVQFECGHMFDVSAVVFLFRHNPKATCPLCRSRIRLVRSLGHGRGATTVR